MRKTAKNSLVESNFDFFAASRATVDRLKKKFTQKLFEMGDGAKFEPSPLHKMSLRPFHLIFLQPLDFWTSKGINLYLILAHKTSKVSPFDTFFLNSLQNCFFNDETVILGLFCVLFQVPSTLPSISSSSTSSKNVYQLISVVIQIKAVTIITSEKIKSFFPHIH